MAHDVFISYANPDKKLADVLCTTLESERIQCWIAPRDVIPGRSYGAQILQAIEASKLLVLVFSANSNASQHVTREVERAVNSAVTILTFRIEDVAPSADLEYFISATHWLDAIEAPMERHLVRLVEAVRSNIAEPVGAPAGGGNDRLKRRSKGEAEVRRQADSTREQAEREARENAKREGAKAAQREEREQRERDEVGHREHHEPALGKTRVVNSEQSETRRSTGRWLFAGGIAATALAVAVTLQLRESPPAPPPASGNQTQEALEAQRDREENARLEAAAAKARAASEIAKLRAETDAAVARAEAEVVRLRAEAASARAKQPVAPASVAPSTPAATSQAEIAASEARSAAAIAQIRAEAKLSAAKAKAEAEAQAARLSLDADVASRQSEPPATKPLASKPEPSTSAVVVQPPAPATAARTEGAWIADRFCAGYSSVPAIKDQLDVVFKNGEFLLVTGRIGFEGYVSLRGKQSSDGKLKLSGYQLEMGDRRGRSPPALEEQYSVVEGQLDGDRYQMKGRMAGRVCTLTMSRR